MGGGEAVRWGWGWGVAVAVLGTAALGAPHVVSSVPSDGAADVDPAVGQIVVTFDAAMKTDGFSVLGAEGGTLPEFVGDEPFSFRDGKTFVLRVKLSAGTAYAVALNSARRQGFKSADGTPLAPTVIRFRTGGGSKPKGGKVRWGIDESEAAPPASPKPRTVDRSKRPPVAKPELPSGWVMIDDKLFGTQVAVPPGWSPRVRGDVAYAIEPDAVPRAGTFFIPMLLKGRARPDGLADGFDEMLRRALPDLRTQTTGQPTPESVQRNLAATISGTPVVGSYRTVVGRSNTAFIMGYLAPTDQVNVLRPIFYKILGTYRYTGPRMRLKPFKSAAVELKIPPGWQVWTSEAKGSAKQDIDWQVYSQQVPGARAFMVSLSYFTPNWVSDMLTGRPDPQGLAIWQMKGFQMANITSDNQALQMALSTALPGLEIIRQQPLEEVRQLLDRVFSAAIQVSQGTGGRMTWYVYELLGRRQVQGVEMRTVATLAMAAAITPGGVKGTLGMYMGQVRGIEAPASHFAQLSGLLDRVNSSFTYTLWWIRTVQKANAQQAETIRKFWAHSNRIDKEIFDNRMKTKGAIAEMMYDNLTDNYAYVNKETGTVEKVPADKIERFRREDGEIVSPEDVIDKQIPVNQARPVREAWADDYMNFDRRVQVWP